MLFSVTRLRSSRLWTKCFSFFQSATVCYMSVGEGGFLDHGLSLAIFSFERGGRRKKGGGATSASYRYVGVI